MKGFPNQVAELSKLAKAIEALVRLADGGEQAKDDGIFGKRSFGRVWRARATRLCPLSDTCEFSVQNPKAIKVFVQPQGAARAFSLVGIH